MREVERHWRALGRPRPPSRGLLEHARAVAAKGALDVVEAYYKARFGGEPPDPTETARLRDGLRGP